MSFSDFLKFLKFLFTRFVPLRRRQNLIILSFFFFQCRILEYLISIEALLRQFLGRTSHFLHTVFKNLYLWAHLHELKLMSDKHNTFIFQCSKDRFLKYLIRYLWVDS